MDEVVIAGAARTPMGGFQGELSPLGAPEIGGAAIAAALDGAGAGRAAVDEVLTGCVLPAGQGQAPAPAALSRARILVTLRHALEARGVERGPAAICIGGSEGTAMAIERP